MLKEEKNEFEELFELASEESEDENEELEEEEPEDEEENDEEEELSEEEEDDEEEDEEDSEEEVNDDDEEDDDQFSAKDLTALPKAIRKDISKLPKSTQSKLVGWIHSQNEEKRKVAAKAKLMEDNLEQYRTDSPKRQDAVAKQVKEIIDLVKKNNKDTISEDIGKSLDSFYEIAGAFLGTSGKQYWEKQVGDVLAAEKPSIDRFLNEQGIKNVKGWVKKNPELSMFLNSSMLFTGGKKARKRALNVISRMIPESLKSKKVKTARASKKKTSKRNKLGPIDALMKMSMGETEDQ